VAQRAHSTDGVTTTASVRRTPREYALSVLAILFLAAPLVAGIIRAVRAHHDLRLIWMAFAAYVGTGLIMASVRARAQTAAATGVVMIFVVAMVLAVATGFALGARAGPGTLMVALVLALCCAIGFALYARSRPRTTVST